MHWKPFLFLFDGGVHFAIWLNLTIAGVTYATSQQSVPLWLRIAVVTITTSPRLANDIGRRLT